MTLTCHQLAQLCDHTLLRPEATAAEVRALVAEGQALGVYSVCVSPSRLPLATEGLKLAVVCGFPSGAHAPAVKALEASRAVAAGADEIDLVIDLGQAKDHAWGAVSSGIAAVRRAAPSPVVLKVIIEAAALTDAEIVAACQAAEAAGADFVKTSTGFHPAGGARLGAVELMRRTVGDRLGVKASGGIRDRATAVAMVEAGATRLGVSATARILAEFDE